MSTRGTYQFNSGNVYEGITTVYIHHDNYPKGAARYFYKTLLNPSQGNLATQFIRANPNAEITVSHDIHGDTEYQYNICGVGEEAIVSVYEVTWEDRKQIFVDSLPLYEFINKYIDDINIQPIVPVSLNELPYVKNTGHDCTIYLNKELAFKLFKNGFPELQHLSEIQKIFKI